MVDRYLSCHYDNNKFYYLVSLRTGYSIKNNSIIIETNLCCLFCYKVNMKTFRLRMKKKKMFYRFCIWEEF